MIVKLTFLLVLAAFLLSYSPVPGSPFVASEKCDYSSLWGVNGEKWTLSGRLPDFSYAGYHALEAKIPNGNAKWNLKRDFHAVGDGKTDDTEALLNAIKTVSNGVLFIPEGSYVISKRMDVTKGNLVIRGAGPNKTLLLFPKSLQDLYGNTAKGSETSQWSFRPGLINVTGKDPIDESTRLARVTAEAKRGDTTLQLSNAFSLKKNDWIRLTESDPPKSRADTGSLIKHLYGDLMPPGEDLLGTRSVVRFLSRVKKTSGNTIELGRPLPYDIRLNWEPEIHRFTPTVQEVGIEHLSIRFPWSPYPGHFKERGYNALFFQSVSQCWVNDVVIQNSDFAIDFNSTNFCTISSVTLDVSESRAVSEEARGSHGHHGIDVSHGTENLVTNFDIRTKFVHDISVEWYALHTVFSNGRGFDLNMDHHREANYSSLFTNIDCGSCTRPFNSGGSGNRGAHAGGYTTYWNVHGKGDLQLPPPDFGPRLNFVGLALRADSKRSPNEWLVETGAICPIDLHDAMKKKRLGR
jgi:hypothetical protein